MADISASTVMELRQRTGLGMMECKKALTESDGDLARAEELLRIKSGAKASKAAGRVAAEGIVGAYLAPDARTGAMVEVNCETDFVSRNEDFIAYAKKLAQLVAENNPADVAALSALPLDGGTVESVRQALVQKIGENMSIRRFVRFTTPARLVQYLHGGGRVGVTVEIEGGDEQVGKDIALHIAATAAPGNVRPVCVSRSEVPPDLIEQRTRDLRRAGGRFRQAARDRRQDGRGPHQQVPGGGDAARAAVRQGSGPDGREVPEGERRAREVVRALCRRRGHREEKG